MAYFAFHKNISSAVFIYLFIYFLLMSACVPETCWEFFVVKINFKFKFYFEKKMPWSFFFRFFSFSYFMLRVSLPNSTSSRSCLNPRSASFQIHLNFIIVS